MKIGVGVGVVVAALALLTICVFCSRGRRRSNVAYIGEVDEYGNRVPAYTAGYEPLTMVDRSTENNVTVNVVQGEVLH